jgi:hypothetical protein
MKRIHQHCILKCTIEYLRKCHSIYQKLIDFEKS